MRKPLKPRNEIIEDLSHVFRAHGFEGASLTLLTQGSGLERASLYHHFPNGKADMAEAVLLDALEKLEREVVNCLREGKDARAKIENMLNRVEKFYKNGNEVCFITIFSMSAISRKVSESMAHAVAEWIKLLAKALSDIGVRKPKENAQFAISSIQGSLVLAHAADEPRIFKNSLSLLKSQWL